MTQVAKTGQQTHIPQGFNYSFTLATFQKVIADNFKHVQEILMSQSREINEIKLRIQTQNQSNTAEIKKLSDKQTNSLLDAQRNTNQTYPLPTLNEQIRTSNQLQAPSNNKSQESRGSVSQQSLIQAAKQIQPHLKNEVQVIQTKMFELFQRVRNLQQREMFTSRQIATNLREFQFSIINTNKIVEKKSQQFQEIGEEIQKIRNELTEYKLKKESKMNKIMHTNSLQQSTIMDNDNYEYLAEKIQFLLKNAKQLLPRKAFEEERESLQIKIEALRKKLNQSVNQSYMHQTLKNTELKIYQYVAKYIKAHQFTTQGPKNTEGQTEIQKHSQLDEIISEGNRELNEKVTKNQQNIKKLGQKIQLLASDSLLNRKQRLQGEQECLRQIKAVQDFQAQLEKKLFQVDRFAQDMKLNLNQKHLQVENQIIDLQQNFERINSQVKTYSYSKTDLNGTFSSIKGSPQKNGSDRKDQDKGENNPETQQDITAQKKKVAKLIVKVQQVKQDMLVMREDFTREIDGLKMGLEKKADWDSLKKGLNYFDEKIRQFKLLLQNLYESSQVNQNGDSLAVKKGWTCLMCDRDIKNYEGKLGEIKFTSVFPAREASPRIGGYYKQQQSTQEYKQIFMSNPSYNRGKRIGSLKPNPMNQSRQDLNG